MEKEITFPKGIRPSISQVVDALIKKRENGERAFYNFEGHILHSDDITLESAYIEVSGLTIEGYHSMLRVMHEKEEKSFNLYVRGEKIIPPEKREKWEKTTSFFSEYPLYEKAIIIMEALENGEDIESIKNRLFYGNDDKELPIIRDIVFQFSNRGPEFYEAVCTNITPELRQIIDKMKSNNMTIQSQSGKQ